MAIVSTPGIARNNATPEKKIFATDLLATFAAYSNKIKILSLDCFDTLLWRKSITPTDVFFDLQHQPTFKELGFTAIMRVNAEATARKLKIIQQQKSEVTLDEIYLEYFPELTREQLNALANEELNVESDYCFAFPPILDLIRTAHAQKIKIIIVSDTYFKREQLTALLTRTLPLDVMEAISDIYCSCELGKSKSAGLFKEILLKLNKPVTEILHIGDNEKADFIAPQKLKIHALHFRQHPEPIHDLIRLQGTAFNLLDPSVRFTRPCNFPLRTVFAATSLDVNNPAQLLGYTVMGPLMFSFAHFIEEEIDAQLQLGKKVKVAFLMRDAYLPSLACKALHDKDIGYRIRISRFTAMAASFRQKKDVSHYLMDVIATGRFKDIANQLLLPDKLADDMIKKALADSEPVYRFNQLLLDDKTLAVIFANSAGQRIRLKNYLTKEMGLERGDTLMFVDLGYSGTAQRLLEPVFREEFGINIIGRYLISLAVPQWNTSRKGLLDRTHCDDRLMQSLVAYIALLEQICTCNEKSVIGYDDENNPIFTDTSFEEDQYNKLDHIHAECVRFIQDTQRFLQRTRLTLSIDMLRDTAIASLARLLFLPTEQEIDYLKKFEFDLNLGTKDIFNIFDIEKGLTGLKRRGLFYILMEKNAASFRTNTPAELRYAGMELALTFLAQQRFTLDIVAKDMSFQREKINLLLVQGQESTQVSVEAHATHDGYFSLQIPLGTGNFNLGILLGMNYQWLEIESAETISMDAFHSVYDTQRAENFIDKLLFHEMALRGGKLYECLTQAAFTMVIPDQISNEMNNSVFRLIFRPITRRNSPIAEGETS